MKRAKPSSAKKEVVAVEAAPRYYVLLVHAVGISEFDITRELTETEFRILANVDRKFNSTRNSLCITLAQMLLFPQDKPNKYDGTPDLEADELALMEPDELEMYDISRVLKTDERGTLANYLLVNATAKPLGGPFTRVFRFCDVD